MRFTNIEIDSGLRWRGYPMIIFDYNNQPYFYSKNLVNFAAKFEGRGAMPNFKKTIDLTKEEIIAFDLILL